MQNIDLNQFIVFAKSEPKPVVENQNDRMRFGFSFIGGRWPPMKATLLGVVVCLATAVGDSGWTAVIRIERELAGYDDESVSLRRRSRFGIYKLILF